MLGACPGGTGSVPSHFKIADLMTAPNILRITTKNGTAAGVEYLAGDGPFLNSDPRSLAWRVASETINQLVELQILTKPAVANHLATYRTYLTESSESFSILHFVFPADSDFLSAQRSLCSLRSVPVWEIAGRILPPTQFYRANPLIADACRRSGAVILDATAASFTTGSVDPLAGKHLAAWIRSALSADKADLRVPFRFHVAIPPHQWLSIVRTHFGGSNH
jgi:hypothetical protein